MKTKPAFSTITLATITAMFTLLTACSGGAGNGADFASNDNPPPNSNDTKPENIVVPDPANYTISGTVTGLLAGHKVKLLSNSTNEEIEIAQDGTFKFTQPVKENTNYQISVKNHPIWRWCDVNSQGTGIAKSNITDIAIVCDDARGNVETLNNVTVTAPTSIAIDSLDNVYVADQTGKKIIKLKPDGTVEKTITTDISPAAITIDSNDNIYIAAGSTLRKYSADLPTTYVSGDCESCENITSMTTNKDNDLYLVDRNKKDIHQIYAKELTDLNKNWAQFIPSYLDTTDYPAHITTDINGSAYFTNYGQFVIYKATKSTDIEVFVGTKGTSSTSNAKGPKAEMKFASPYGIAADKFGNFYVSDNQEYANTSGTANAPKNNAIRIITADGRVRTLAGSANSGLDDGIAELATFNNPHGVAVDSRGYVYVADKGNNKIRRITPVK